MTSSTVQSAVDAYLLARRRLGYDLKIEGEELRRFAAYADRLGHRGPVTTELALRWAQLPVHANPIYRARRLDMVRRLARHRVLYDPKTEIPPKGILGPSYRRPSPHIYSPGELEAILSEAARLGPQKGLRSHTYKTLFGLLICTGLRISEALRLTRADVDFHSGVLTITQTKFKKSRLAPIHWSASRALRTYALRRDRYLPSATTQSFFLTEKGTSLKYHKTLMTFLKLRESLGWADKPRPPRIHDLRHTFAVRTLLRWYQEGVSIDNKIVALSTYLGHTKVSDTYWYISAVPELLAAACSRFETHTNTLLGPGAEER